MSSRISAAIGAAMAVFLFVGSNALAQSSSLDPAFDIGTGAQGGFIESMAIQPDGKILVCGNFTSFNGQPKGNIARLNPDGSVDPTFTASVSYWVRYMAIQQDGKIVIGGYFNYVEGQSRNLLARLNPDGSLDNTFDVGTGCVGGMGVAVDGKTNAFVFAIAVQPDQKILVGGNFTNYNGVQRRGVVRLNTNGVIDTNFSGNGVNNWLRSMRIQDNGQIILTGWFTEYNNRTYNRMVRVNSDGSADPTFNAYFGDYTSAYTSAGLEGGKMIVGGHTINTNSVFQQEVVRLNVDGTYDTNFNNGGQGANDKIESVAIQSDGKIVIGGYLSLYNGVGVQNIARLNADGSLDASFTASVNSWIWTVLIQKDGKILICGGFTDVNGVSRNGIARFASAFAAPTMVLLDSKIVSNHFQTSLLTQNGLNYSLQYKNSATGATWTTLPSVIGNGAVKTLFDPAVATTNRFYRVVQN
ncbi:MAG: delta-60 repeat domain-containing protein [Verrucomicrobiota bacterium]